MAIASETMIHTLRGPVPAHQLAAKGEKVRALSWREDRIGFAEVMVTSHPVVPFCHRVVLDNGTSLVLTNTTLFLGRQGDAVGFEEVINRLQRQEEAVSKLGAITALSVMPLYRGTNSRGYATYRQLRDGYSKSLAAIDRRRMRPVARMVYEQLHGPIPAGMYVRHKDGDRNNCEPENLRLEGKPKAQPSQTKLHRHIKAQHPPHPPNNHKIVGVDHWGDEEACQVHVLGEATNYAAGGVFLLSEDHGA